MGIGIMFIGFGILFLFTGFLDEPSIFLIIIGIFSLIFGIFCVFVTVKSEEQTLKFRQQRLEKLKLKYEEEGLEISQDIISTNNVVCAIDEINEKICFLNYIENSTFSGSIYSYNDILEVELILDGETITKTSRSSQIGGALLGSVLAGGVGAVIGGLSGKTSSKERVGKVQLKIIVNDIKNPYRIITFLDMPEAIEKSDQRYLTAKDLVTHWHSLFKVIIETIDKDEKITNSFTEDKEPLIPSFEVADELRKLHQLFKEGIITEKEFDLQKEKIIY